jgi:hypothetical protein
MSSMTFRFDQRVIETAGARRGIEHVIDEITDSTTIFNTITTTRRKLKMGHLRCLAPL